MHVSCESSCSASLLQILAFAVVSSLRAVVPGYELDIIRLATNQTLTQIPTIANFACHYTTVVCEAMDSREYTWWSSTREPNMFISVFLL